VLAGTDPLVAWAAGFLDGEAHVGINRIRDRRVAAGARLYRLNPRITVGQVAREPLERLQDLWGGAIALRPCASERHNQASVWRVGGARQVAVVLRDVLPLLTVKRRESEVVLELCERIEAWSQGTRLTADEIDARNELSARLCAVKVGGRGALPVTV
jgi:hypothetical protein